jgi:phenylacetate-CoA ligase
VLSELNLLLRVVWRCRSLEQSCHWTRDRLELHQSQRVAALRRFAFEKSAFYQRYHRGLEDRPLEDLPILTKSVLMDNFDDLVTDPEVRLSEVEKFLASDPGFTLFRGRYVVLLTSGSTWTRGMLLFDSEEWVTTLANCMRPMVWTHTRRGPQRLPRSATIASTKPWHISARVGSRFARSLLRLNAAEPLDSIVRRLNEWRPKILTGYPSVLRQLAEEQIAGRLHLSLESINSTAEVLTDETRQRVHEAWGVRVCNIYAATEYAPIAAECAQGGMHLIEDGALIEIVDERGRAVPPGVCGDRLLLTVFASRTQPLIRYEITDLVRPIPGECECGRKFRLIGAVEGLRRDLLTFPHRNGGNVAVAAHAHLFYPVLESLPATAWQMVHDERGLWVFLVGLRESSALDEIRKSIHLVLERQGALVPPIHVREIAALERGLSGKAPQIISRMPR